MAGTIYSGNGSWLRNAVVTPMERLERTVHDALAATGAGGPYVLVLPVWFERQLEGWDGKSRIAGLPVYCSHEVATPTVMSQYLCNLIAERNSALIF